MKMRGIDAAHAALLAADPACELTKTALRRMVVSGRIPSVRMGNAGNAKYLIDLDTLERYLFTAAGPAADTPDPPAPGALRRLEAEL